MGKSILVTAGFNVLFCAVLLYFDPPTWPRIEILPEPGAPKDKKSKEETPCKPRVYTFNPTQMGYMDIVCSESVTGDVTVVPKDNYAIVVCECPGKHNVSFFSE